MTAGSPAGRRDVLAQGREKLLDVWKESGREGTPKTMGLAYFALGETGSRTRTGT